MSEINNYKDIGHRMLKHPIFKEKYEISNPDLDGNSPIEKTLKQICNEKDDDRLSDQERSSTTSINRKLNSVFNIGG